MRLDFVGHPLKIQRYLAELVVLPTLSKFRERIPDDGRTLSEPAFELTREAGEIFTALVDYFREYRDCADVYAETQTFEVYDDMQSHIHTLQALRVSRRYATRKVWVKWGSDPDSKPTPATVLYVAGFPLGKKPEQLATPKFAGIRL